MSTTITDLQMSRTPSMPYSAFCYLLDKVQYFSLVNSCSAVLFPNKKAEEDCA